MPLILGISAGRKGKVTDSAVRAVLDGAAKESDLETSFISLAGKLIRPCEACNGCADDNRCVLKDDLQEVLDQCHEAEAIVFGAPRQWNHMNAKALAFWERACFSGRHNAVFPLAGKYGLIVAVAGSDRPEPVVEDLTVFFQDARMHLAATLPVQGEYACFTCGYGNYCAVGGFKNLFPLGTEITPKIMPSLTNQHPEKADLGPSLRDLTGRAREAGRTLARLVEIRADKR